MDDINERVKSSNALGFLLALPIFLKTLLSVSHNLRVGTPWSVDLPQPSACSLNFSPFSVYSRGGTKCFANVP